MKAEVISIDPIGDKIREIEIRHARKRNARIAEIRAELENAMLQQEWLRKCVRLPIPPITANWPPPKLDFGLASLIAYAKWHHRQYGDQDAAATLRVLRVTE